MTRERFITKEEAKELLPFIKALAEGKTIQDTIDGEKWFDTDEINLEYEGKKIKHRIKPEPKYRPFKDMEECWQEMLKHQPFGWLKAKESKSVALIGNVYMDKEVWIVWTTNEKDLYSASEIFNNYVFADGTPFGVKED